MSKNLLIVFVKNMVPGTVKTRLAKEIGIYNALEVYQYLVDYTCEVAEQVKADRVVYYSEYLETGDFFSDSLFKRHVQSGVGLGDRMQNAFKRAFDEKYDKAVIIGSDCYALTKKHIDQAFDLLDANDAVVGPAKDGGYYLIGMKRLHEALFRDKTYGHDQVFSELLAIIHEQKLSHVLLEKLSDIDTYQDLKDSKIDVEFLEDEN